jgi:hypothetical protein
LAQALLDLENLAAWVAWHDALLRAVYKQIPIFEHDGAGLP